MLSEVKIECSNSPYLFQCVEQSLDTLGRLSRTFKGESNTDVSSLKDPLLLMGHELGLKVRQNVREAIVAILDYGPFDLRCGIDAENLICSTAARANEGLLRPDRPLMRTWDTGISRHSPVEKIIDEFRSFAAEFAERWRDSFKDPIKFAAWVERRSNANGHFFTDGCGRIARALSIAVLSRAGLTYPSFESRNQYFDLIGLSEAGWEQEYRSRVGRL